MNEKTNTFDDERLKILRMVEEGKLSADEAVGLLNALAKDEQPVRQETRMTNATSRFFRVRVTDNVTGRHKALVSIPLSLMDWGLKIGAQFAPEVAGFDVQEFTELVRSGADGKIVDVLDEEDGEHVEVFID